MGIDLSQRELYLESAKLIASHIELLKNRGFVFSSYTLEVLDASVELYKDLADGKIKLVGGNYEE